MSKGVSKMDSIIADDDPLLKGASKIDEHKVE
jgi:hypothetical protein